MSYVPDLVALYEINPFIILELDNESVRVALKDYLEDGKKKDVIIKKYGKIEDWNTSNVTDMSRLFYDYMNFNEDISKWDTSNVTKLTRMFNDAKSFNLDNAPWYHE